MDKITKPQKNGKLKAITETELKTDNRPGDTDNREITDQVTRNSHDETLDNQAETTTGHR